MYVVLYVRVSAEEAAQKDLSIPAQKDVLQQYCQRHGFRVLECFEDAGYSALIDARTRPAFQDMMRYCTKHKPKAVLVYKYDRFCRNQEDARLYKSLLQRAGVKVLSINEPVDDSPAGFLLERMLEVFAEFAPRNQGRDIARGFRERAKQGQRTSGRIPYGYTLDRTLENGRWNSRFVLGPPDQVETVRRMFALALEGYGASQIATRLNSDAASGCSVHWRRNSIYYILRNPLYCGQIRTGRTPHQAYRRLPSDPHIYDGIHPSIVERSLFDMVQTALKRRNCASPDAPRHTIGYLCRGLLKCGVCGASFTGYSNANHGRRYYYYRCHGARSGLACTHRACIAMPELDSLLLSHVLDQLTASDVAELHLALTRVYERKLQELPAQVTYEPQRKHLQKAIARWYAAIEAGIDLQVCKTHLESLQAQLNAVPADPPANALHAALTAKYQAACKVLDGLRGIALTTPDLPKPFARQLLTSVLDRAILHADGRVDLIYNVSEDLAHGPVLSFCSIDKYQLGSKHTFDSATSASLALTWRESLTVAFVTPRRNSHRDASRSDRDLSQSAT